MKKIVFCLIFILIASVSYSEGAKEESKALWSPTKHITIIVPWAAGGGTDQSARLVAGELEDHLKQKIVIVNQEGASGSIGTKACLDAPRDGYTWTAGVPKDLALYEIMGFLDTDIRDWHLFLSLEFYSVIAVNPDTPYKSFDDLLKAFKEKPGEVIVATAGENSVGDITMKYLQSYIDFKYKHVNYPGGNPAVIACVSGEAEVVPQLTLEEVDMLRAGKLRALAVMDNKPLELAGYGTIPPITNWIPEYKAASNYLGIWIPKGAPQKVVDTFGYYWDSVIKNSKKLKEFADSRGCVVATYWGEEAQKMAFPWIQISAWVYHDSGKTVKSPEAVGIPRP